jgi:hypothetical protein
MFSPTNPVTLAAMNGIKGTRPGLPDGIFSNQNTRFGQVLVGLAKQNFGIFMNIWVYFTALWYTYIVVIWYILWLFGIFFAFWYVVARKIWQQLDQTIKLKLVNPVL